MNIFDVNRIQDINSLFFVRDAMYDLQHYEQKLDIMGIIYIKKASCTDLHAPDIIDLGRRSAEWKNNNCHTILSFDCLGNRVKKTYYNGFLHSFDDEPAYQSHFFDEKGRYTIIKKYYDNGQLHRIEKPAMIIYKDHFVYCKEFYFKGNRVGKSCCIVM